MLFNAMSLLCVPEKHEDRGRAELSQRLHPLLQPGDLGKRSTGDAPRSHHRKPDHGG